MIDVVTGAFGYIGRHISARLLESGRRVKTITTHVDKPNPFGARVEAFSYDFDRPDRLTGTLQGVDTLYNTYWIRFPHSGLTFETAVRNTEVLFRCARQAGVRKIVHVSVTCADERSPLPYYAGKGRQEAALKASGVPHAIVRPTLVFGKEDILVNNIAWLVRRFPIFPIFGDGRYRLQPVYVGDLATIATDLSQGETPVTVDAIGPQTFTFDAFVRRIAAALERRVALVHVPPAVGIALGNLVGRFVGDVILTRNELRGLMDENLTSSAPPSGQTRFSDWLDDNRLTVGASYTSELDRHFRWRSRR